MSSRVDPAIEAFLAGASFAVAGASASRAKYGNKVLRCYWQAGRVAYPVNPARAEVEGAVSYPSLAALPEQVHGVSLITPPGVSDAVVSEALELGIRHFWFQPGSEHEGVIGRALAAGAEVIADGSCILVVLGFRERSTAPVTH